MQSARHWRSISAWYLDGYEAVIRRYFERKGWEYQEHICDKDEVISSSDYCLRLGITLKQFDYLYAAGIKTIADLVAACADPLWYRPIRGVGPKSSQDILNKLDRLFIHAFSEEKQTANGN